MINIRSCPFTVSMVAAAALFAVVPVPAIATDIANSPLVTSSPISVKPNLMYILDDSGSMARDYVPDNVNDGSACRADASDSTCGGGGDLGSPNSFSPPFMAKEFNSMAYNPAIRYLPPIDYDGANTTFKSYDNGAGYLWTAVKRNPFASATTYNLTASFPERWFCDGNQNSTTDRVLCRRNLEPMIQPTLSGSVVSASATGPVAGLYTITVRINIGSQAGAATHGCAVGDALTVSGNPLAQANGAAPSGTPFTTFRVTSVVNASQIEYRYTNAANTQPGNGSAVTISACHQIFPVSTLTRSGTTATLTLNNHGCRPGDTIRVAGTDRSQYNGQFTVGTVPSANTLTYTMQADPGGSGANASNVRRTLTSCPLPFAQLTRGGTTATATYQTDHGCSAGDTIRVTGAAQAAYNITATVTGVPATNQLTYTVAGAPASPATQASATVPIRATICPGTVANYSNSTNVHPQMQGFPQAPFNQRQTVGQPVYYTIRANEFCTNQDLTNCQSTVPTATNSFPALVRYCHNATSQNAVPGSASSTSNNTTVVDTTGNTGCQRAFAGNYSRPRYGYLSRQEIKPSITTYPKVATRTDCTGATCTYAEEMTNFANWFAYYRARMLMMKTASGLAFNKLNPTNANAADVAYRVGFHTINNTATLVIAPFAGNSVTSQKANWYTNLYATVPGASTPLRESLARVGRYFAGQYAGSGPFNQDPIEYSCQQNVAFLTTDGYWNGPGGVRLDGTTAMGDQDGVSGTARPFADHTFPPAGSPPPTTASTGGDGLGTLADVAFYYYNNDLRTPGFNPTGSLSQPVHDNNLTPSAKDPATHQHMTTFTMGLGLDSLLVYAPNYDTAGTSADFNAIVSGSKNWPAPAADTISAVDDLWHAAVNGRGTYFSAKDPNGVIDGLTQAFLALTQVTSTAAAAATSNPNIISGDNFLFASTFSTLDWFGEVTRQSIDVGTGAVSPTIDWSAAGQLDTPPMTGPSSDVRTIYTFDSAPASKLKTFTWANLTGAEQALFDGTLVPHFSTLTGTQQGNLTCAGCGAKILEFVRGQRQYEASTNSLVLPDPAATALFRRRIHVLGDIVSAEAVYVRTSPLPYGDPGHQAFRTTGAPSTRPATLYVAANDGMLHAFNATTGAEVWTYIPSEMMPKLVKLADKNYANAHQYFVDGTPTTGDVCVANCNVPDPGSSAVWKTILVGGFNAGGRGYYALDVTNPTVGNVNALWELKSSSTCIPLQPLTNIPVDPVSSDPGAPYFADCDLGLSFGNPIITKRADGKWVVLVTSGYNNTGPGTGGGFLYVIDAATGEILSKIPTLIPATIPLPDVNAGDATTPSGLARINAFATNTAIDNTALRVYGGDLNGNLWRFDNNSQFTASGNTAKLLAIFGVGVTGSQGNGTQPIQTKPELGEIKTSGVTYEMVYVGTGKFLGTSDLAPSGQQSMYGVKDTLTATPGWGVYRDLIGTAVVQQPMTELINPTTFVVERLITASAVDLSSKAGWVVDLNPGGASPGERSTTDPTLDLGTLTFTTNVPSSSSCTVGGKSFIYSLNYSTGGAIGVPLGQAGVAGQLLGQALATRPVVIRLPGGRLISLTRLGSGATVATEVKTEALGASGARVNWRELGTDF